LRRIRYRASVQRVAEHGVAERAGGGNRGSDGGRLLGAFDAGAYAGFFAGEGESAGGTGVWEGDRE